MYYVCVFFLLLYDRGLSWKQSVAATAVGHFKCEPTTEKSENPNWSRSQTNDILSAFEPFCFHCSWYSNDAFCVFIPSFLFPSYQTHLKIIFTYSFFKCRLSEYVIIFVGGWLFLSYRFKSSSILFFFITAAAAQFDLKLSWLFP